MIHGHANPLPPLHLAASADQSCAGEALSSRRSSGSAGSSSIVSPHGLVDNNEHVLLTSLRAKKRSYAARERERPSLETLLLRRRRKAKMQEKIGAIVSLPLETDFNWHERLYTVQVQEPITPPPQITEKAGEHFLYWTEVKEGIAKIIEKQKSDMRTLKAEFEKTQETEECHFYPQLLLTPPGLPVPPATFKEVIDRAQAWRPRFAELLSLQSELLRGAREIYEDEAWLRSLVVGGASVDEPGNTLSADEMRQKNEQSSLDMDTYDIWAIDIIIIRHAFILVKQTNGRRLLRIAEGGSFKISDNSPELYEGWIHNLTQVLKRSCEALYQSLTLRRQSILLGLQKVMCEWKRSAYECGVTDDNILQTGFQLDLIERLSVAWQNNKPLPLHSFQGPAWRQRCVNLLSAIEQLVTRQTFLYSLDDMEATCLQAYSSQSPTVKIFPTEFRKRLLQSMSKIPLEDSLPRFVETTDFQIDNSELFSALQKNGDAAIIEALGLVIGGTGFTISPPLRLDTLDWRLAVAKFREGLDSTALAATESDGCIRIDSLDELSHTGTTSSLADLLSVTSPSPISITEPIPTQVKEQKHMTIAQMEEAMRNFYGGAPQMSIPQQRTQSPYVRPVNDQHNFPVIRNAVSVADTSPPQQDGMMSRFRHAMGI